MIIWEVGMKRSRIFVPFMVIILVFCICFALVACVKNEHTHDWAIEWSSDEQSHWHKCNGCNEKTDLANHTFVDGVCICGKEEPGGGEQPIVKSELSYSLSDDESYAICGGFLEGKETAEIEIASEYDGKPVREIGYTAFKGLKVLTKVTLPDTIQVIGEQAFFNCSLQTINIPNGTTKIAKNAFAYTKITKVVIPDSVTELGDQVFWNCKELVSAKIGNNVSKISSSAFRECDNLSEVAMPENLAIVGDYAFYKCGNLSEVVWSGELTNIAKYAFYDCNKLPDVTLTENLTSIGTYAFYNTSIENVVVPNSVQTLDKGAFYQCKKLKSAQIDCAIVSEIMFKYCYALENVTIGNNVKTIGPSAFYNCTALYDMYLPQSVTSIGSSAFTNCYALTLLLESATLISGIPTGYTNYSIVLDCKNNKRATDYKEYFVQNDIKYSLAYDKYGNLKEDFVRIIRGQRGFAGELEIPDTVNYDGTSYPVKYIEDYAFQSKGNITKLQIGNNVDTIGVQAFQHCQNIDNIVFGNKVKTIKKKCV